MRRPDRSPATARPRRRWRSHVVVIAAIALPLGLGGCFTGERPTLVSVAPIDDPAISTMLERLERAGTGAFTATYEIAPTTPGIEPVAATVTQNDDGLRRVSIGPIDYITDGTQSRTCEGTDPCAEGLDDTRISNLNVTHRFWGDAFAARLRTDASRQVADATGRTETIAGFPAVCVDVPVFDGSKVYCALDEGLLARYIGADVTIELTSFERPATSASGG